MMSSCATTSSHSRIDHRTVLKNLQIETNNNNNNIKEDKTVTDSFNPINKQFMENTENSQIATVVTQLSKHSSTTSCRGVVAAQRPRRITSIASCKTKIPYPLIPTTTTTTTTAIWTYPYCSNFKRSSSLRLRGTKSNLPLIIMEPTINETSDSITSATTPCNTAAVPLKEECIKIKKNTHNETSPTQLTGGRFSSRRKLALISQTASNAADSSLKRSLSLRRNFKVSSISSSSSSTNSAKNNLNKTDSPTDKICVTKNLKSLSLHDDGDDVDDKTNKYNKDQGDDGRSSTATMSNEKLPTDIGTNVENVQDNCKMSLNPNGVTTDTTVPATQHTTRPVSLATTSSTSPSTSGICKTAKSPRTPNIASHTATTATSTHHHHNQYHPIHSSHQPHHSHQQAAKPIAGLKLTPKTPPVTPDSPTTYLDDDLDSLFSYGTTTSGRSTMSCEHPYVARNGTTFSGRKMKYVVHCSNYAGQVGPDYLTPTQRAQRQLRRLKELLISARHDLEQKDSEILRLTREVVELRLFKASLSSPEERSASSDAVTVREAELKTSQDVSPIVDMVDDAQKSSSPRQLAHHQQHLPQSSLHHHHHHHNMLHLSSDMQSSFADSGHFEDMTSSSVHSKDSSYTHSTHDQACGNDDASCSPNTASVLTVDQYELQRQELIRLYEQRIEDLIRSQDAATSDLKRSNCDRIEALLQKLAECNTRYADIVPDYEHAKERIRELEKQLEELQRRLIEHEEKQKQMYLHMYQKGQEAERIARADQALELAHRAPQNKVSINELLHQLQSTQDELENIRAAECRNECGNNHALLTAKEAISLWVLGARKTIYRRLMEAQKNRTHVDPEVTLQFLKSAVYYFLTDKENSQGHLQAIESILEFSEAEKQIINKARTAK